MPLNTNQATNRPLSELSMFCDMLMIITFISRSSEWFMPVFL